ncbi:MAG: hypothetical protein FWC87_09830 [Acidimicrobiaceae bacterium]|nr:hypothetical protein [Acidimicrobiaceae bacterium]
MSRRIDIELTSAQPDGRWTWRAAGARQPKGILEGEVLYEGAKAGDVVRAEAEFEIDGITIVAVLPPKDKKRPEAERIELLGPAEPSAGLVTTQLVGRSDRRSDRRDRPERRSDRRDRPDGPRREGGGRDGERAESGGARGGPRNGGPRGKGPRPSGPRDRGAGDRSTQDEENATPERAGDAEAPRRDRSRPTGERPGRGPGREGGRASGQDAGARGRREGDSRPATPAERRSRRLNPANVHRQAVLDSLPAEQQAVAEQLLRGGIPAVRTAISLEREKAVAEGRPAPNAEELLLLAESLLPRLKTAEWRDRAEAAAKAPADVSLRDLRSVVAGADAARDDESRTLAGTLREALDARVNSLRTNWTEEIERHLAENRIVRGLRLSGRPPEPSARLSAELSERISAAASTALNPETSGERWVALLEAVAESPVRRLVKPAGLPANASPEVLRAAHQQAGRVPALAGLLGIAIPPPPGPRRPAQGSGGPPPRRGPAGGSGAAPVPSPPSAPTEAAATPEPAAEPTEAPEPTTEAPEPTAETLEPAAEPTETPEPAAETPEPAAETPEPAAEAPEAVTPAAEAATPAPESPTAAQEPDAAPAEDDAVSEAPVADEASFEQAEAGDGEGTTPAGGAPDSVTDLEVPSAP